jgi:HPt (histidine-containing phosphotransfer) domain-containing protein
MESKPIDRRALEEAIAGIFHRRDDIRFGASPKVQEQDGAPPITWDIAQTLERFGGDEKLLREVVGIFLEECPKQITSLRGAIANGDAADIERTAHGLKGELGYLGIPHLSQMAGELEGMGGRRDLQHTAEVFAAFDTEISAILNAMRSVAGMNLETQLRVETDASH